jgi:hypothetical protein
MDIYDVENTSPTIMDTDRGQKPGQREANPWATKVTKVGIAPGLANTELNESD